MFISHSLAKEADNVLLYFQDAIRTAPSSLVVRSGVSVVLQHLSRAQRPGEAGLARESPESVGR